MPPCQWCTGMVFKFRPGILYLLDGTQAKVSPNFDLFSAEKPYSIAQDSPRTISYHIVCLTEPHSGNSLKDFNTYRQKHTKDYCPPQPEKPSEIQGKRCPQRHKQQDIADYLYSQFLLSPKESCTIRPEGPKTKMPFLSRFPSG